MSRKEMQDWNPQTFSAQAKAIHSTVQDACVGQAQNLKATLPLKGCKVK